MLTTRLLVLLTIGGGVVWGLAARGVAAPLSAPIAAARASEQGGSPEAISTGWERVSEIVPPMPRGQAVEAGTGITLSFVGVGIPPEGDTPGEIAYTPDGAGIVIAHRDTQNLIIFDAATRDVTGVIALSGSPNSLAISPDGTRAVTANLFEDTVSIVDLVAGVETAVVAVGDQPGVVRITPDGTRAVVGNSLSSSLSVVDLASATETLQIAGVAFGQITSFGAWAVSFVFTDYVITADSSTLIFPDQFASRVQFFDLATGAVVDVATQPNPARVALSPDGSRAAVAHSFPESRVTVLDVASQSVIGSFATGSSGAINPPITISGDGNKAVVTVQNNVRVMNLNTGTFSPQIFTGTPGDLKTTANGLYCVVGNFQGSLISFASESVVANTLDTTTPDRLAVSPVAAQAATAHILRKEVIEVINTNGAGGFLEEVVPTGPPPEGDKARNVAISADGSRAVVINNHSQNATIIDLNTMSIEAVVPTGERPGGVAITPDGLTAVVANLDSTFATVIDLDTATFANIEISRRGSHVAISPDGQFAYIPVVASGDGVWRINVNTLSVSGAKILTGNMGGIGFIFDQASGMTLSHDGATLVTCGSFDNNLSIIDTAGWTEVARVPVGVFPVRAAFSPDDGTIYVSNRGANTVSVVRNLGAASNLIGTIPVGDFPFELTTNPAGSKLYVENFNGVSITVADIPANTVAATIPLPPTGGAGQPVGLHVSADGSSLYVAANGGDFHVIDTASNTISDTLNIGTVPAELVFHDGNSCGYIPSPNGGDGLFVACVAGTAPAAPLAEDSLAAVCTDDTQCANEASCVGGICYAPKNRYVSVAPNPINAGVPTARRVGLDIGIKTVMLGWVGPPDGVGVARVDATPFYMDWSAAGVVQIGDCEISPGGQYVIQAIAQGADVGNEANFSAGLTLPTVAVWGDVKGAGDTPADGIANFDDVLGVVFGFQGTSNLPPSWLDLGGEVPDAVLNLADVQNAVFGFQDLGYPFSAPLVCPTN